MTYLIFSIRGSSGTCRGPSRRRDRSLTYTSPSLIDVVLLKGPGLCPQRRINVKVKDTKFNGHQLTLGFYLFMTCYSIKLFLSGVNVLKIMSYRLVTR